MPTIDDNKILHEFKCPNCAGVIEFDAKAQLMKCPFCESEFDVEALKEAERLENIKHFEPQWEEYTETSSTGDWQEGEKEQVKHYVCQFCAGEIMTDAQTAATKCPYCGNTVAIMDRLDGVFRPDLVLPFEMSKEDAKLKYEEFLKNKKLLPNCFKDKNHIDEITGIYVPFWLFDCTAQGEMNYKATKVRTWSDHRFIYTKTSHYSINRAGQMGFAKVPADGSKRMDDTLMEAIEPYNYANAVDFKTAYLSGFLAEKYDVKAEENQGRINQRIGESLAQACASTVQGYTSCHLANKNIQTLGGKINYALLPVWILNTKYEDENYTFAMNGQTGKFVGKLPIDKSKKAKYFAAVFAASSLIGSAVLAFTMFM